MHPREDHLTASVIGAVIRVHQELGPGFLERIYRRSMEVELQRRGLPYRSEVRVEITYLGVVVGVHVLDLVVAGEVVVELKCVGGLSTLHYAQVRSYLKATGLRIGLLVNFADSKADYRRILPP
jgi:GxxExxY protein